MANFEMQLNSRLIREGKEALRLLMDYGITIEDFRSSEGKGMFTHLLAYYNDASSSGSLPGIHAARILFPSFELCDDQSMQTGKICEELRRQRQVLEIREVASRLAENCDQDPAQAMAECQTRLQLLQALGTSRLTDIPFDPTFDEILFDYEQTEAGVDTSKMPWPWQTLQDETMGLQEDDYVVFYGRPKSKKSWVLAYLIAWAYQCNKSILVYTKEMTPKNIMKRVAAILATIPYREFRRGKLDKVSRQSLFSLRPIIQKLKMSQNFVCLSGKDVTAGGDTIPWLRSKIEKHRPDVQFVDGLYLMSDSDGRKNKASHEKMTSISRAYRQLILDTRTPGIATLQANRKAAAHSNAELDEIAYSDAIGQDATIAARVIAEKLSDKDRKDPTKSESIALVFGGSREFEMQGLRIGGVPATDFEQRASLTEKDINKAKEHDANDPEADKKTVSQPRREPAVLEKAHKELLQKQLESMPMS